MKIYTVVVAYIKHLSKLRVGIRVGRDIAIMSLYERKGWTSEAIRLEGLGGFNSPERFKGSLR